MMLEVICNASVFIGNIKDIVMARLSMAVSVLRGCDPGYVELVESENRIGSMSSRGPRAKHKDPRFSSTHY